MRSVLAPCLLAALLAAPGASAETVQPGQQWLWSPNAGWLDARPLGAAGPGLHVDGGMVSGWLWSSNLGWISAHCANTGSCSEVPYGLWLESNPELPDFLRLVGKAWSENAGWIMVSCITTGSCASVEFGLQVHRDSGVVDGFAWSPNLGWLSVSCANTGSCVQQGYGLQFDPAFLVATPETLFGSGFED